MASRKSTYQMENPVRRKIRASSKEVSDTLTHPSAQHTFSRHVNQPPRVSNPDSLLNLQHTLGNASVTRLLSNTQSGQGALVPTVHSGPPLMQRMVALAHKKAEAYDWADYVGLNYAFQTAGPPVSMFDSAKFGELGSGDTLALRAHGSPGKIGDYTADEVGARLADPDKGLKQSIKAIHINTCQAGTPETSQTAVDTVKTKLKTNSALTGIPVVGSRGFLVPWFSEGKALSGVVNSAKDRQAGWIQTYIEKKFGLKTKTLLKTDEFLSLDHEHQANYIEKFVKETDRAIISLFYDFAHPDQSLLLKAIQMFLSSGKTVPDDPALLDTFKSLRFKDNIAAAKSLSAQLESAGSLYIDYPLSWQIQ